MPTVTWTACGTRREGPRAPWNAVCSVVPNTAVRRQERSRTRTGVPKGMACWLRLWAVAAASATTTTTSDGIAFRTFCHSCVPKAGVRVDPHEETHTTSAEHRPAQEGATAHRSGLHLPAGRIEVLGTENSKTEDLQQPKKKLCVIIV